MAPDNLAEFIRRDFPQVTDVLELRTLKERVPLGATYFLVFDGYDVSVDEKMAKAGGFSNPEEGWIAFVPQPHHSARKLVNIALHEVAHVYGRNCEEAQQFADQNDRAYLARLTAAKTNSISLRPSLQT